MARPQMGLQRHARNSARALNPHYTLFEDSLTAARENKGLTFGLFYCFVDMKSS